MNKSPLTTFLLGALVISALASVALCYMCTRNAMRLVELQTQVAFAQNREAFVNSLAKEVLEYSSRNPAIDPILEAANLKPSKTAPNAATPKPTAR
jgi:hypothetical protein